MRFILKIVPLISLFLILSGKSFAQSNDAKKETVKYLHLFSDYEYTDTLKARIYADSALFWARKSGSDRLKGDAHRMMGWYYHDRSKFDLAIAEYYQSLSFMQKAGLDQGVADAYGNLGNAFYDKGDLQKSLNMQLMSLKINEEILEKSKKKKALKSADEGKAIAIHNIGDIYGEIAMYSKAFEYAFESLKHDLRVKDTVGIAISYNTIATLYKQTNKVDSAEYFFRKSIALYEQKPQPYEYGTALIEFATLEGADLTMEERSEMALKALNIRKEMGDTDSEASTLIDIAGFFFDELSEDSLSTLLERAYYLMDSEDIEGISSEYFKVYSKYNSRIGNFKEAFFALEDYLELKAIADEKQRTYDLIAGGIRYQVEYEFRQDSLKQQHDFAKERNKYLEDISDIQNIVYLSVIGFIVLIVSLFYYVTSNRRRKRLNDVLVEKNQLVQEQKSLVEEKNKSISDSINYARRLQSAILPTPQQINEFLPDSFLMFLPKDVVSGDFYWFETKGEWCFLAVADCTGHGVPGAMVSVVCSNALNRSVNEFNLSQPSDILDKTRELVIETFAKSGDQVSDGMDISLVAIHIENRKIVFSGAHNGLWIVRKNEQMEKLPEDVRVLPGDRFSLIEWKGDKQPIGLFLDQRKFSQTEIDVKSDDQVYMMSDGFADQFGGPAGKKYKYVALKRFILQHCEAPMETQKQRLIYEFETWKGDTDQVDDVCVIGLRF